MVGDHGAAGLDDAGVEVDHPQLLALEDGHRHLPGAVPHCADVTNVPPDGAIVGKPDDHTGRSTSGTRAKSVIGTLSL